MLRSRRGSAIVESALLWPLIIIVSVSMLLMMVHFYVLTFNGALDELESRRTLDYKAGTVLYADKNGLIYGDRLDDGNAEEAGLRETSRSVNECRVIWQKQTLKKISEEVSGDQ